MSDVVSPEDTFLLAGLQACGGTPWGTQVSERRPGVYVIAVDAGSIDVGYLPPEELIFWNRGQRVVYIGCTTTSLKTRLDQFYRHRYGSRAPHRGGQAVKLLMCQRWVYWAAAEKPHDAECSMIEGFKARVNNRRPYANRRNERRV